MVHEKHAHGGDLRNAANPIFISTSSLPDPQSEEEPTKRELLTPDVDSGDGGSSSISLAAFAAATEPCIIPSAAAADVCELNVGEGDPKATGKETIIKTSPCSKTDDSSQISSPAPLVKQNRVTVEDEMPPPPTVGCVPVALTPS
jgi:hypothetical protein